MWLEAEQDLRHQDVPNVRLFGRHIQLDKLSPELGIEGDISFKLYSVREPNPSNILRGNILIHRGEIAGTSLLKELSLTQKEGSYVGSDQSRTPFDELGAWIRISEDSIDLSDVVLSSKNISIMAAGIVKGENAVELQGTGILSRKESRKFDPSLSSSDQMGFSFAATGQPGSLSIAIDKKSITSIGSRIAVKEIESKINYLGFLDRLSPKSMSLPDKAQFLKEGKKAPKRPRKKRGGFFEIFFGRR